MSLSPIYNDKSQILILGSYPSVISFNEGFYYANPRNRFWDLLSCVFEEDVPKDTEQKCDMLLRHRLALWDSVCQCDITGSSDASIKNVLPNDIKSLCNTVPIKSIICNGAAAAKMYIKYNNMHNIHFVQMPSTSPANAVYTLKMLKTAWKPHLLC